MNNYARADRHIYSETNDTTQPDTQTDRGVADTQADWQTHPQPEPMAHQRQSKIAQTNSNSNH